MIGTGAERSVAEVVQGLLPLMPTHKPDIGKAVYQPQPASMELAITFVRRLLPEPAPIFPVRFNPFPEALQRLLLGSEAPTCEGELLMGPAVIASCLSLSY